MNPRTPPQETQADRFRQMLYVLTADDAARIQSMIELVSNALWELLECRKIELPARGLSSTDELQAEETLYREKNAVTAEWMKKQEF